MFISSAKAETEVLKYRKRK